MRHVPPDGELRSRPCPRQSQVATGTCVHGLARAFSGRYLRASEGPARNGGHSLAEIVEHATRDPLVGWAWNPGADREPAPGSQAAFGALVKAWAASGAACPVR